MDRSNYQVPAETRALLAKIPKVGLAKLPRDIKDRIPTAFQPENYKIAVRAIEEVLNNDQIKHLTDEAVMVAAYARQFNDRTMLNTAIRIHTRAAVALGEFLSRIPTKQERGAAFVKGTGRIYEGGKLGLTDTQVHQFVGASRVDRETRERLIEAHKPATVSRLYQLGSKPKNRGPHSEAYSLLMSPQIGWLQRWRYAVRDKYSAADLVAEMTDDERVSTHLILRQCLDWVDSLDELLTVRINIRRKRK